MKRTLTAVALISLIASTAALADPGSRHRRDSDARHRYESSWDDRHDHRRHHRNHRHYDRHDSRHERRRVYVRQYYAPHGYYHRTWRRGDRLPRAYYARQYVLYDHRAYHLHAPPRGYHWVRVNHDVVLAAIATGIVLDVLYNHFD
jgi:Ni/Co efflux regulator RcnB